METQKKKLIETGKFARNTNDPVNNNNESLLTSLEIQVIVICISRSREKLSPRARLRPRHDNLEDVKRFRGQGV
jgi:hypothetical protein